MVTLHMATRTSYVVVIRGGAKNSCSEKKDGDKASVHGYMSGMRKKREMKEIFCGNV